MLNAYDMLSFASYSHCLSTRYRPYLLNSDLLSSGCLIIILFRFACPIALAAHHLQRLSLDDFLMGRYNITVSPSIMNLDLFSRSIKANIACFYLLPGDRLTFLSFDALPHHIGTCTLAGTLGLEPKTSYLTGKRSNQLSYVPI